MNTFLKFILIAVLIAASVRGSNPLGLDPAVDARIHAALHANYRMDFAQGAAELAAVEQFAEDHPLITFGDLLIEWWKVTAAVWEEDRDRCEPMLAAVERSLAAAEKLIEAGDPTGEGHLVKGATLGLLGRWHIKNRHWMKSYFIGKDAKANLERALEINPALQDANSGIGIYDYFVAKLPGIVRWLAFSGQTADPSEGMRKVEHALEHGTYTVVGTRAALSLIFIRNELDPEEALTHIDQLIADHPHSPFFGSLRLIALYDLNRPDEISVEAERQAALLASGDYPAERAAQIHFARGLAEFRQRNWAAADAAYAEAVALGHESDPFATWARLHRANILDVRGERREARAAYREIRKMLNRWGTERLADRYLDDAFDPAVHQLRLLPDG